MPQPTEYERQYNFTNYQTANPSDPLPAAQVDAEFNAVKNSLDETQANLALIQRDDGALKNASVGFDQLKAELSVGISPATNWTTATAYLVGDSVTSGAILYRCLISHTSGVFATDLAALKWQLIANFYQPLDASTMATVTHAATNKPTPADTDEIYAVDSASSFAGVHFTWANLKAAIWAALGALIAAGTAKATPVDADTLALSDSAASGASKKLTWANVKATLKTYFDGVYVRVIRTQVFTGSGTYTPNANTIYCIIEGVGGGGGGGGAVGAGAGAAGSAGSGGSGSYARAIKTLAQIGASQVVTIGAAGAAGTAGSNNGGAGGDTSVGVLLVAKGGSGGTGGLSGAGGAGGVLGTGDTTVVGQPGGAGSNQAIITINVAVGSPGRSYFGGGLNAASLAANAAGAAGTGYGNGGQGAGSFNSATSLAGGAGSAGYVIITEFCSQ